jgi:nitrogen fixation protein FixH
MKPLSPNQKSFNPWPVSIIAFFAVAICAAVTFVIFCRRNSVDLVAADYYEQELRYQDKMDSTQRAASLQAPAKVGYDELAQRITVSLPSGHLGDNVKGWIELYRPSAAGLDQKLPLHVDATGDQVIDASKLADGLWRIRISWNNDGADYYHDQKLVVGQKST